MNKQALIGVFDSGVGGLSVWREIVRLMPTASTLYLADQAHVPYGARSLAQVEALTHAAVTWLLMQGADIIVIACNTASAAALTTLRQHWPHIPIVGMEPAVKPASQATKTGHVGVLATPGTLRADRFSHLVERFANGVHVHTLMGSGLVEMVENGQLKGPTVAALIQKIMAPVQDYPLDHLVLGCTHFPFLAEELQNVLGPHVKLVDPAPAVARQTWRMWQKHNLGDIHSSNTSWQFVTTGDLDNFRDLTQTLVGEQLSPPTPPISFRQITLDGRDKDV